MPKRRCKFCEAYASFFPHSPLGLESVFCFCGLPSQAVPEAQGLPTFYLEGMPLSCPQCLHSLEEVLLKRRLGCSHCYKVFEGYLADYLSKLHKSCQHLGKVPHNCLSPQALEAKLEELRNELDALVTKERFQDAALVKNAIKSFTATLEMLLNRSKKVPNSHAFPEIL